MTERTINAERVEQLIDVFGSSVIPFSAFRLNF